MATPVRLVLIAASLSLLVGVLAETSHAQANRGIGNRDRIGMMPKRFVWRGKTYREPKSNQMEGVMVLVREVASKQFEADVWLYSAEETSPGSGDYKLTLKETYLNQPLPYRVQPGRARPMRPAPARRPELGMNDELNLVMVADVPGQDETPADERLKRRILLTASRPRNGSARDEERTVRFVTYTYYENPTLTPCQGKSDPESGQDGDAGLKEPGNANSPQQAKDDQDKQAESVDKDIETGVPVAVVTPCTDYPDDAVLIETEMHLPNEPIDPPTMQWMDYPDWDW